jgi:hypothetical protein
MGMERFWNAGEAGQRTWIGRRQVLEAPVKDGGHVACRVEVATSGRCLQVEKWVLTGFDRQHE